MFIYHAFIIVLYAISVALCTDINGTIDGILGPGNFRATGDISVPRNKQLILRAGTTICFDGFVTFNIDGHLLAEGTLQNRIILTSARDRFCGKQEAEPMDWNHLKIGDSGRATLKNTDIYYSTDGILALANSSLIAEGVILEKNGLNRILINGSEIPKTGQGVYNYPFATPPPLQQQNRQNKPAHSFKPSRRLIATGATLLVGAGVTCVLLITNGKKNHEPSPIPDPPVPPNPTN